MFSTYRLRFKTRSFSLKSHKRYLKIHRFSRPAVLGAFLMVASEFAFASMGAIIKLLSQSLSSETIVFLRNILVIIILLPWMLRDGIQNFSTTRFRFHALRAVAGVGAMYCFFYSLSVLPLAEASLLKMTTPLFIPLVGALWLKEAVPMQVRLAILIGFIGVLMILKPGMGSLSWGAVIGLAGGALAAVAKTSIRYMSDTEPSTRIVFYFALIGALVSSIPMYWAWVTPSWTAWGLVIIMSTFATLGQLCMTRAYQLAPAAQMGIFSYTAVLFASLYGWIFWDEWVDHWFFMGTAFVLLAGFLSKSS
jgi:drug/metabolite transporter (DMT)-like permease